MFKTRLVSYLPGTNTRLHFLPRPLSWEASVPHNDTGALRLTYSTKVLGGPVFQRSLRDGIDISLQINWGAGWVEPDNCRFLLIRKDLNVTDKSKTQTLVAPSYGWLLGKTTVGSLELLETSGELAGERLFQNATAGSVMRPLLDEYYARHTTPKPAYNWDFTASLDSAGVVWPTPDRSLSYRPDVPLTRVLQGLASMKMADWRFRKHTLKMWNTDTQFADRSHSVKLRNLKEVTDAPSTETIEDAAGYLLVFGEGNVVTTMRDSGAPSAWGVWEAVVSVGGAQTVTEAETMAAAEQEYRAREAGQYTRSLNFAETQPGSLSLPFRDYLPGDIVSAAAGDDGFLRPMRVLQIMLSQDTQGRLGGAATLNDRLVPVGLKMQDRLSMLVPGAPSGTGNVPTVPPRPIPKAPTGLILNTNSWWNYGVPRATVGANWTAVTQDTDGRPITVKEYVVKVSVGREARVAAPTVQIQDLPTSTVIQIQVAAVSDKGVQGAWSSVAGISTAVPPNTLVPPTALALSTGDGLVRATWDGKLQAPPAAVVDPPGHLDRIIVLRAASANGPWTPAGSIHTIGGSWLIPGDVGQTVYVRGVAVDRAGNQTGPGPVTSITITSWVTSAVTEAQADADAAMAAASNAQTTADGRNRIRTGQTQPATPAGGWVQGDQWYVQNASAQTTSIRIWNGSSFVAYQQVADSILVPGSAGTVSIANGAITAPKLTVSQAMIDSLAVDSFWASKIKAPWLQVDAAMIDALTVNTSLWANKISSPMLDVTQAMIDKLTVNGDMWANKISTNMLTVGALSLNMIPNGGFEDGLAGWTQDGAAGGIDIATGGSGVPRSGTGALRIVHAGGNRSVYSRLLPVPSGPLAWRITAATYGGRSQLVYRLGWYTTQGAAIPYTDLVWATPGTGDWQWTTWSGRITPPAGAASVRVQIFNANVDGTLCVDNVQLSQAIQGDMIVAGAVTAEALSADAIDGKTITGATINGGTINGGTITGTTVQTATSGVRTEISGSQLKFSDATQIRAYTGPDPLWEYNGYPAGAGEFGYVVKKDNRRGALFCDSGNVTLRYFNTTNSNTGYFRFSDTELQCVVSSFAAFYVYENYFELERGFRLPDATTTSSANAALISADGGYRDLKRTTSLSRYKVAITDLDLTAEQVLNLRPRMWFDKTQVCDAKLDPDVVDAEWCLTAGLRWIPGLVAEEVEQDAPIFATYEYDQYNNPVLDGVAYDRIASGLLLVGQQHRDQIAGLTATVAEQAARITALESLETTR